MSRDTPPLFASTRPATRGDEKPPPRYVQGQIIGSGGAGAVYTGWDQKLRRNVAIKRFVPSPDDIDQSKEDFLREAHQLASVTHPHILSIHDVGADQKGLFMVTEFVPGRNLREIAETEPLSEAHFLLVARQTLCALATLHGRQLAHNDLKPENLLISEDGAGRWQVKLLDFGCARASGELPKDQQGHVLGSLFYVAPEVVRGGVTDLRSDLYALGLVFYFALSGRDPFDGDTPQKIAQIRLTHDPVSLRRYRSDLSRELIRWVERLMQREPRERPATASSALRELDEAAVRKPWWTQAWRHWRGY